MAHSHLTLRRNRKRQGAILILIAIALPVLLIMIAMAVDVAWIQLVRSELRTATDAASRAGARSLGLAQNEAQTRLAAIDAAGRNMVAGKGLPMVDADIEIGEADQLSPNQRFFFNLNGDIKNAVRVRGHRTSTSAAGPVGLFLSNFTGVKYFSPSYEATSAHLDRDVCLVVDRSGSMNRLLTDGSKGPACEKPVEDSRWTALSKAVDAFIEELDKTYPNEGLALVSYSSEFTSCDGTTVFPISKIHVDLSLDYMNVRTAMADLTNNQIGGRTSISAGIDDGVTVLTGPNRRSFALPTMVLMTDGLHNLGREPVEAAAEAANRNIVIHTITFSDAADLPRMQSVANATGGTHYHANTADDLIRVFREIARTLPVMVIK